MFNYYFNIGLIYFLIGFSVAFFSYYLFKKKVFGNFVGAVIVALVGSYLGGVFEFVFFDFIEMLRNVNNVVNIFPPLAMSIIFIWIYSKVSDKYK